ncbi:41018_t:CDS:2, partial [Gigaspora margarita]
MIKRIEIEEWIKHNINIEKDLPKSIIESEECSENDDNNLYYKDKNFYTTSSTERLLVVTSLPSFSQSSVPFFDTIQQENSNFNKDNQWNIQIVNSQICVHMNDCITLQQTTSEDAKIVKEQTILIHDIVNNQRQPQNT